MKHIPTFIMKKRRWAYLLVCLACRLRWTWLQHRMDGVELASMQINRKACRRMQVRTLK